MLLRKSREIAPERMKRLAELMWKQCPVVDVPGGEVNVQCSKQQYCTGTWNVKSLNQGKLDMVKQEMVRINIDIVGISGLKYTEMGEFNFSSVQSLSPV